MGKLFGLFAVGALGAYAATNYLTYNEIKKNEKMEDVEFSPTFNYSSQIQEALKENKMTNFTCQGSILGDSRFKYEVSPKKWCYQVGYPKTKLVLSRCNSKEL